MPFVAQALEPRLLFAFELVQELPQNVTKPFGFTTVGGQVLFAAEGQGVWATDGTSSGTHQLAAGDANTGWPNGGPLVLDNGHFLFRGNNAAPAAFWYSDGTSAGTRMLSLSPVGIGGVDYIDWGAALGNRAVVVGQSAATGIEAFITDGTTVGTTVLTDTLGNNHQQVVSVIGSHNGLAFLIDIDLQGLPRLAVTDGTVAGTRLIADLNTGGGATAAHFTVAGSHAYFQLLTGQGWKLWRTDGTTAGTGPVPTVVTAVEGRMAALGGTLYFVAGYAGQKMLYRTDGTANGTYAIASGREPGGVTNVGAHLAAAGGSVYFNVVSGPDQGIWRTDGSTTKQVLRFFNARSFTVNSGRIWFGGLDYYAELSRPDDVRLTRLPAPVGNWSIPQIPFSFGVLGDTLIFPHDTDVYRETVPPKLANIHVTLVQDDDGDGIADPTEGPYLGTGAYVYVDSDNDGVRDSHESSMSADLNGLVVLHGYGPGVHVVRFVDSSARNSGPDAVSVTVAAGQLVAEAVFAANRNNRARGEVYDDQDGDGIRDLSEPGLAGRLVYLDTNANAQFDAGEISTTTAVDGTYFFEQLHGSGTLRVELPSGWRATQNGTGFSHSWYSHARDVFFNPVGQTSLPLPGTVNVSVYFDNNGDNVQGPADYAVGTPNSAYLDLDNDGIEDVGEPSATTVTGQFRFTGVAPGVYTLRLKGPSGWLPSSPPTVINLASGQSVAVTVGITPNLATPSIYGRIFADDDLDALKGADEGWRIGQTVFIDVNGDDVHNAGELSSITDFNGVFRFQGLPAGSYRVVTQPGYSAGATHQTVAYDGSTPIQTSDFALSSLRGRVVGRVYVDANSNGMFDGGDVGVPNARVSSNWGAVLTDAAGVYRLPVGATTASVALALPVGYTAVSPLMGSASIAYFQPSIGPDFRLGAGTSSAPSGIRGRIFHDVDGDGIEEYGEPAGGTLRSPARSVVYLDLDRDGIRDAAEPTANWSSRGEFVFGGLPPAAYELRVEGTAGAIVSTPASGSHTVTLAAGELSEPVLFGVRAAPASVFGVVWLDIDHNGVRTEADPPAVSATVAIDINGDGNYEGVGDRKVVTGSEGLYGFQNLSPGTYNIKVVPDNGFEAIAPAVRTIILTPSGTATEIDFGIERVKGTLSGGVFSDANRDGVLSTGESLLGGWRVRIEDVNDSASFWFAQANVQGTWTLSGVPQGTYRVGLSEPLSTSLYITTATTQVTLGPGESASGLLVGLAARNSTVSGYLRDDANGNGSVDNGEGGRPGVTVYMDADRDGFYDSGELTAVTDASGRFAFSDYYVQSSSLRVGMTSIPPQTIVTFANSERSLSVVNAQPGIDVDMGEMLLFTPTTHVFSGHAYRDVNANGVRDAGEPGIAGRTISFGYDVSGNGRQWATTDENGFYAITSFDPRDHYYLRDVLPHDWLGTAPPIGGYRVVAFRSDETYTQLDFGSIPFSATGTVFGDGNGNGLMDTGESGIAGRIVYLDANQNGLLDAAEHSATTDPFGRYGLAAPVAGTYQIRQLLPSGSAQSYPSSNAPHLVALDPGTTISGRNFGVQASPPPTTSYSLALRAAADAHVRNGTYSAVNYGPATSLEIRNSSVTDNSREAYFSFDLTQISSSVAISSAVLRLFGRLSTAGTVNLGVYAVAAANWTESALTWSNKPAAGALLLSKSFSATTNQWLTFDVTSYLKQQKQAGATKVSVVVKMTAIATPLITFASDEASGGRPELVVSGQQPTSPPPTSPPPTSPPPTSPPPPSNLPLMLRAIADAHVRDGQFATSNYGLAPTLELRNSGVLDNTRHLYLTFNLNEVPQSVSTATLRLNGKLSLAETVSFAAYAVPSTEWSEASLTWSNRPPLGSQLATASLGSTSNNWVGFDLSAYIRQQKQAGATSATVAIRMVNSSKALATFLSDEAASLRPELIVMSSPTSPPTSPPPPVSPQPPPVSPPPTSPPPTTAPITLRAVADTYVRDGSYAAINYATESTLTVKGSSATGYSRRALLKFDLSSVDSVNLAELHLSGRMNQSGTPVSLTVHVGDDQAWTEGGVTWDTQPTAGAAVATFAIGSTSAVMATISVTSAVRAAKDAGKTFITFVINASPSDAAVIFNADEAGGSRPMLTVK